MCPYNILDSEVSIFQGFCKNLKLGKENVSLLEVCHHFMGVLREGL